jgi:hypothetical protein
VVLKLSFHLQESCLDNGATDSPHGNAFDLSCSGFQRHFQELLKSYNMSTKPNSSAY